MSKAAGTPKPPLALVVQSGAVDRVHYALLFAAGALAMGRDVTLFFTMAGCKALEGGGALLPAEDGTSAADYDAALLAKGIAGFDELWESLEALGAKFQACDTGLLAAGITAPEGVQVTGVVGFLGDVGANAQVIWV
jgi:peroxiredoxin family protein